MNQFTDDQVINDNFEGGITDVSLCSTLLQYRFKKSNTFSKGFPYNGSTHLHFSIFMNLPKNFQIFHRNLSDLSLYCSTLLQYRFKKSNT